MGEEERERELKRLEEDKRQKEEKRKQREEKRQRERLEQKYGKDDFKYISEFLNEFTNSVQHLSHDHQWRPRDYVVSEKADGQRCFVLCSIDGSVWCVRTRRLKGRKIVRLSELIYI